MNACHPHVHNDPDPQCSRHAAPDAQGAGGAGGHVAVRLPARRNSRSRGAPDRRGTARTHREPGARDPYRAACRGDPAGTRFPLIVVDASVVFELLLLSENTGTVAERLFDSGDTLAAPHLVDAETAHILRRYARAGEIGDRRGREALADLADLPIRRFPHIFLLPRVWDLRHNLTVYDAVHVALAEALDAPLVMRDRRLARAAGHGAEIEVL